MANLDVYGKSHEMIEPGARDNLESWEIAEHRRLVRAKYRILIKQAKSRAERRSLRRAMREEMVWSAEKWMTLKQSPEKCVSCGYHLFGLTEARCPECGTAFDEELLGHMREPPR